MKEPLTRGCGGVGDAETCRIGADTLFTMDEKIALIIAPPMARTLRNATMQMKAATIQIARLTITRLQPFRNRRFWVFPSQNNES